MIRVPGTVLGLLLATGFPRPALPQQRDTVVAGAHYRAGWFHRVLLGTHHRNVWTTPVAVEVLDLSRYAGGLSPDRCGGGAQTKSLRLLGADGRQYVFRSVDKDPTNALPPDLRQTFVRSLIQDQISSELPGAPLIVASLLNATNVLHASPHLVVLPYDPRLAGIDCVKPGLLGMIEERPTEPPDNDVGFAGAVDLASTKKLLDLLERDSDHRVDSRDLLAARLMDAFVGDWDRHHDQWRWARFDSGSIHWWRPIPRDRDQAFSRMDGILIWLAGFYQPQLVGFGDDYPPIWRLTYSGRVVDRRMLVDLARSTWDSVALALRSRLTDSVIDAAVRSLPPAYYAQSGPAITRALRRRRDHFLEMSHRFYASLAQVVEVHGTDRRDVAVAERERGALTVTLSREGAAPYYRRTFDPRETDEVRVFLHGGDDRFLRRGDAAAGPDLLLRVIGGGGNDQLVDSARTGTTRFYDDRGQNQFVRGPHTTVDRRHYDPPARDSLTLATPRDWGAVVLPLAWVSYGPDVGAFLGAGLTRIGYGFRRLPFRSRVQVRAGYATAAQTYRAEFTAEFRDVMPRTALSLRARASGIDIIRFYGFGNTTVATGSIDFHKVIQRQYLIAPALDFELARAAHLALGPVFKSAQTRLKSGTLVEATRPYGVTSFNQIGAALDLGIDTRDFTAAASRGVVLQAGGSFYPAALDVRSAFGEAHADARTYLIAHVPLAPTLALRVGGKKVWGTYPLHEAAYIGGWSTVRGFPDHRFAGDAAVFGSVELRFALARFNAVLPGELGVFGLGDGGRVFVAAERSDLWHAAAGGGLWLAFLNRANTVSLAAAQGDDGVRLYARAGFAF